MHCRQFTLAVGLTGQVSLSKVLFLEQGTLRTPSLATVTPCTRPTSKVRPHALYHSLMHTLQGICLRRDTMERLHQCKKSQSTCDVRIIKSAEVCRSHMQEAALEGLNTHDGFSLVTEALLHHQIAHIFFLDVDVAVLQPRTCQIYTPC